MNAVLNIALRAIAVTLLFVAGMVALMLLVG